MKILVDLLSTDYGLMSFIVIIAMLVSMGAAAIYVIVKAKKQ
jgi:hypothetical protein